MNFTRLMLLSSCCFVLFLKFYRPVVTAYIYRNHFLEADIQKNLRNTPKKYMPKTMKLPLEYKFIALFMFGLLLYAICYLCITKTKEFVPLYMCGLAIVINIFVLIYLLLYKRVKSKDKYLIKCYISDVARSGFAVGSFTYVLSYYDFITCEYKTFTKIYSFAEFISRGYKGEKREYIDIIVENRCDKLKFIDIYNNNDNY